MSRAQLGEQRRLGDGSICACVVQLLLVRPLAADAVGVVGVEVGAVSTRIGNVVGEAGQPSSGSIASKFLPSEGFMRER